MKKIFANLLLFATSFISLYPFYTMLMLGTYKTSQLSIGLKLLPGNYMFKNLETVFTAPYGLYYLNSVYIAILNVLLVLLLSTLCAYGLTKFHFKGSQALFMLIIATMLIPGQLSTVAFIIEMKSFGLLGTHLPLILPAASPFAVFWFSSYMRDGVPNELTDAARIDGCHEFSIFFRIVLPLIKPALGTMALLAFLGSWNNFMVPMIILNKPEMYTLPIGVKNFGNAYLRDTAAQILALNLAVFPVLIVFAIFNKNMIRNIAAGAIKG